jgi:hypothetical protein
MSGESNVIFWLEQHGIDPRPDLVQAVFDAAKQRDGLMSETDVLEVVEKAAARRARLAEQPAP